MRCFDIVWMVVSPRPSHPFGLFVVWHDVVVLGELLVANWADSVLFDDLLI